MQLIRARWNSTISRSTTLHSINWISASGRSTHIQSGWKSRDWHSIKKLFNKYLLDLFTNRSIGGNQVNNYINTNLLLIFDIDIMFTKGYLLLAQLNKARTRINNNIINNQKWFGFSAAKCAENQAHVYTQLDMHEHMMHMYIVIRVPTWNGSNAFFLHF
jgi:hypothetical protein